MKPRNAMIAALATASLLTLTAAAQAQNAAPANTSVRAPAMQQRMAEMRVNREQHQAQRAQALHDILAITPAQEGAWTAFRAAMKPPQRPERGADGPGQRPDRAEMARLTTPQRLDKQLEASTRRHSEVLARINATRQFYAQLSPTQKKAFDALPAMGHDRGGPGERMGRKGGPRGGDHRMGPGGRGGFGEGRGPGQGQGPRGPRGGQAGAPASQ